MFAPVFPKYTFYVSYLYILGTRPVLPCKNGSCCKLELLDKERVCLVVQSLFVCRWLLTGETVKPVSLIALVPTVHEKSVFYGYLPVASVSLGLPTQFMHCCLVTARAFMPASLIVIPYTTLEISKFLGQLPVDDDDDDEKSQLNPSIASLRSEKCIIK